MFEHRDPSRRRIRTYELSIDSFNFDEGEVVFPGQIIGQEVKTGRTIKAFCFCQIATAYFNPMNKSYLVMIYLIDGGEEKRKKELEFI